MSTVVAEIKQVLPSLSNDELRELERAILQTFRERRVGIIFDDDYGILTGQDLAVVCEEVLELIEQTSPTHDHSPAR